MNRRRQWPAWRPLHRSAPLTAIALFVMLVAGGQGALWAQPFPDPTSARDTTVQPLLHVDATVHKMFVQAVESDGTLWLDFEGRALRVRLEDVVFAAQETEAGREARKVLGRFIGRAVRFAFRGVGLDPVEPAHSTPAPSDDPWTGGVFVAYAPIVDHLLERGLARYCPGPARSSSGLLELERRARQQGLGIWRPGSGFGRPSCESSTGGP